jgi:molybdopterin-containing oxidoreductase family iron-sulfur binding subunit
VGGCAYQPVEKIVPYVRQPEELIPGKPLFFASAFTLGGYANGILAESHENRPTKIEGNPEHPASLGATDAFTQASILTLYDPDRSQSVRSLGDLTSFDVFSGALAGEMENHRANGGAGLRILTETVTSPTLISQITALLRKYPGAKWYQYEPVNRDNVLAGARLAFGREVEPIYDFSGADKVLSLDSNFFIDEPGRLIYSREFIDGRRMRKGKTTMNRLYVVESTPTITGGKADHRLPLPAAQIEAFARAIAAAVGVAGASGAPPAGVPDQWITELASDLKASPGASVVIAGPHQPPTVHALAHAMNAALGNVGKTVSYIAPVLPNTLSQTDSLRALADEMRAGRVDTLIVMGANPVYNAPSDLKFADAMNKVPLRVHLGLYDDETGVLCQWHVPESHYLEAWGDARAYDGTLTIQQPLIQPLYESRAPIEFVDLLLGNENRNSYDIVRGYWTTQLPAAGFNKTWQKLVHDGYVPGTAARPVTVAANAAAIAAAPARTAPSGLEINFRPDPTLHDGRFANNVWLQECPKPFTKMTWDNPALVSPKYAEAQNLRNGEWVEIAYKGNTLKLPVIVTPGQPENAITVYLGGGRTQGGKVLEGVGGSAYTLRRADSLWFGEGQVSKAGGREKLSQTQVHFNVEGRALVRAGTLDEFLENPDLPKFMRKESDEMNPSHYPADWPSDRKNGYSPPPADFKGVDLDGPGEYSGKGYNGLPIPAWGMVVDLNACIGCNSCVIACQSENNVASVGKDQVLVHREMHWLRIDTYFAGDLDDPDTYFQPVMCMQCEKAPCEPVCPVEATTHSAEGINEMTYNRCVGTRYCSNNCPYKVRRFNFMLYADFNTPSLKLMRNPDVTVRSRGVMEKCTYCVQRINQARVAAKLEDREIRDGDVVTACQAACPTDAIVFGNINDPNSEVSKRKASPLNYPLLAELNTRPRTTYLAVVRNPNAELGDAYGAGEGEGH